MTPDLFMDLLYDFVLAVVPNEPRSSEAVVSVWPGHYSKGPTFSIWPYAETACSIIVLESLPLEVRYYWHHQADIPADLAVV